MQPRLMNSARLIWLLILICFSAIEKSWKAMLYDLTVHFDAHPYLLGGKPCIGDFSLAGMTYAHLYRDPVPGVL